MSVAGDAERAYTVETAMRISGATRRQIDYWASTGLVPPATERLVGARRRVRLWGFQELVELLVVVRLKERGASLQSIRKLVNHIRSQQAAERPLSEITFGVDRETDELYWTDERGHTSSAKRPAELVLSEVLDLEEVRHEIRTARTRGRSEVGKLSRRRGLLGQQPVFAGTRTPVAALRPYFERDYPDERILAAFPHLDPLDVEVARSTFSDAS